MIISGFSMNMNELTRKGDLSCLKSPSLLIHCLFFAPNRMCFASHIYSKCSIAGAITVV